MWCMARTCPVHEAVLDMPPYDDTAARSCHVLASAKLVDMQLQLFPRMRGELAAKLRAAAVDLHDVPLDARARGCISSTVPAAARTASSGARAPSPAGLGHSRCSTPTFARGTGRTS